MSRTSRPEPNEVSLTSMSVGTANFYGTIAKPQQPSASPSTPPLVPPELPSSKGTPVKMKSSGRIPFISNVVDEFEFQQGCLAEEMNGNFLGPMNPQEFLNMFLPKATSPCPKSNGAFEKLGKVLKQNNFLEKEMYQPFVDAAKAFVAPGFKFVNTSASPDKQCRLAGVGIKPDISLYASNDVARMEASEEVTDFAKIHIHGEFKTKKAHDPFRDETAQFEHSSDESWLTMGQMVSYAIAQFTMQFRTCIFSFGIFGDSARIIRWDRSGAVVTESFSYLDKPQILAEFFWRYSNALAGARGQDMTVEAVTVKEDYEQARVKLGLGETQRFVRFIVYDDNDPTADPAEFIGPAPQFTARSLTGRATRTFVVWDPQNKCIVLLKDTWRVDLPDIEKEGSIYARLIKHQVPHIATFHMAGDIPSADHATRTYTLADKFPLDRRQPNMELRDKIRALLHMKEGNINTPRTPQPGDPKDTIRPHRHYRLVLRTVGRDLMSFSSTKELVTAVRDAALAHGCAWDAADILHRDISVGNIMITTEGRGILIDWDLAKSRQLLGTVQRQFERTGTWQFISAALLTDPGKPHELADDVESFFLTLIWTLLRFSGSNADPGRLSTILKDMFDSGYVATDGLSYGGETKALFLAAHRFKDITFNSEPINQLIRRMSPVFSARYLKIAEPEESPNYETQEEWEDALSVWRASNITTKRLREKLNTTRWFVALLDVGLAAPSWPLNDKAERRVLPSVGRTNKRPPFAKPDLVGIPPRQQKKVKEEALVEEEQERQGKNDTDGGAGA